MSGSLLQKWSVCTEDLKLSVPQEFSLRRVFTIYTLLSFPGERSLIMVSRFSLYFLKKYCVILVGYPPYALGFQSHSYKLYDHADKGGRMTTWSSCNFRCGVWWLSTSWQFAWWRWSIQCQSCGSLWTTQRKGIFENLKINSKKIFKP